VTVFWGITRRGFCFFFVISLKLTLRAVTRALNCYGRIGRLFYPLSNGSRASGSVFQGVLSCFSFVVGRLYPCTGGTA
jgi:hypothetical protein